MPRADTRREPAREAAGRVGTARAAPLICWTLAAGFSAGTLLFQVWLAQPLATLVLGNAAPPGARFAGTWIVLLGMAAAAAAVLPSALRSPLTAEKTIRWLRPVSAAFLLPSLLSPTIWHADPLFSLAIWIPAAVLLAWSILPADQADAADESAGSAAVRTHPLIIVALVALMAAFAGFVAAETVQQHRLLETRAYDLGIMENVLWHTSHGRLLASSLEGRNHLGVHSSFILLVLAPVYRIFPRPETLLVAQAVLLALAAWPLFLLARSTLRSAPAALLVAFLYLLHPAVQGAAFYDFHELAFAPLFFFAALLGLRRERTALLWMSVCLLLLVKEDCAFLVAALGVVALLDRRTRTGLALLGTGAAALLVFQGLVIPHFAGGASSFAWYYGSMIPAGEGPVGLLRTLLLNPVYSLHMALTGPKVLYVLQTLGPTLFLCFFGLRGMALVAYGLAISVFATREHLFELGFQYPLQLVPQAFAASLLALREGTRCGRTPLGITRPRALLAMAFVSGMLAYHHGMLSPVSRFRSGFRLVDLHVGEPQRDRYREVWKTARLIPDSASVTASETLVPHVARRTRLQTLRYAADTFGCDYDYFFILRSDLDAATKERYAYVLEGSAYRLIRECPHTLLYRRSIAAP